MMCNRSIRAAASSLLLLIVACGSSPSPIASTSTDAPDDGGTAAPKAADPTPDAGASADAGSSATADGGNSADAGAPPDAGPALPPAPALEARACPGTPAVLWSRTFSVDVDFNGAVDEEGNLYWIEHDPPRTNRNLDPPAFLASADSDGKDRYRVPLAVVPPYGGLIIWRGGVVAV
jgi:hypothetical protein